MSNWKIGGIRIIVTDDSSKPEVKMSEHIILDGQESILHYFGYGSDKRTLKAWLLDNPEYLPVIRNWYRNGSGIILSDPFGNSGAYKINELSFNKVQDIKRVNKLPITLNMTLIAINSGSY